MEQIGSELSNKRHTYLNEYHLIFLWSSWFISVNPYDSFWCNSKLVFPAFFPPLLNFWSVLGWFSCMYCLLCMCSENMLTPTPLSRNKDNISIAAWLEANLGKYACYKQLLWMALTLNCNWTAKFLLEQFPSKVPATTNGIVNTIKRGIIKTVKLHRRKKRIKLISLNEVGGTTCRFIIFLH